MKTPKAINLLIIFSAIFLFVTNVFAQVDVPRETRSVTYPVDETVMLKFRGTTRFPRMKGEGKIQRTKKNGTEIELSVSKMPRPFELGAGYATYIVWAISPDGQVDNLGEIKRRGFFDFDSKISVTTPLQNFALIITAEPHYLVRRPSRAIMLENLNPYSLSGKTLATTTAVQYFGNSSDYFSDTRTPEIAELDYSKTPSTLLQAKQAVALAKFAGAERDAKEELAQSQTLLLNAENSWKAGRDEELIDITARQAIGAAVKAETTAAVRREAREKRNEKTRQDADIREAENKITDAQGEAANIRAELTRETRNRELAERDAQNYANQVRELQQELGKLREELGKTKVETEAVKAQLGKIEDERKQAEQQQAETERRSRFQMNQGVLMQSLRRFGAVTQDERGIILTLPENYWSGIRVSSLAPTAEPKLTALGEVLATSAEYKITVEAHTDNKGMPEELELLTNERARAISDKMMSLGVSQERIEAKGFGAALPVAPNSTNANRAKNRRVQIILAPSI